MDGDYEGPERRGSQPCSTLVELSGKLKMVAVIAALLIVPSITGLAGVLSYVLIEGHKSAVVMTTTIQGVSRNRHEIKALSEDVTDHEVRIRGIEQWER